MRSESCTFIWHPKVVTWNFFGIGRRVASALLDGERSFHPGLAMAWDGAVNSVGAGLEFGGLRFFAFCDRFESGEFLAFLFDHHVVGDRRRVLEVDRDLARFGGEHRGVEGESRFVRFDLQGGAGAGRGFAALWALALAAAFL